MPTTNQLLASIEVKLGALTLTRISSVSINQPFDNHHSFEVSFTPDMLPDKPEKVDLKDLSEKIVGEAVTITLKQGDKDNKEVQSRIFKGIATSLRLSRGSTTANTLVVSGVSPTALLSAGRTTRSFTDKTLEEIVTKVLSPLGGLAKKVSPTTSSPIRYVTQYEEDNFHFLQRLAEDYGEWMYYDGVQLVFGKNGRESKSEVKLIQGENFFEMQYSVRATPLNLKGVYYDYYNDKTYEAPSSGASVNGLGTLAELGRKKSENVFNDELIEIGFQNYRENNPLKRAIELKKSEQTNKLAVLTGRTSEMQIPLGGKIKVEDTFTNKSNKKETTDYGTFVVTRLSHYLDSRGVYQCSLEAVPQDTDFAPVDYRVVQTNAEPQPAVVMKVDDKDNMGRVKVQFPWQKADNEMTPWLRVVNPMASKDKGVYFIPEVGEVVFVDFEFGNPDVPFVTGSMYHGQNRPGELFNKDNNIKGIITKGGNHIIIDDTDGKEKIRIYNKESKNEIELSLDGGSSIKAKSNGTIFLEAAKGIQLKAPKIKMEASEEWDVKAGKTQIANDQGMEVSTGTDMKISASTSVEVSGQTGVKVEGMTVDVNAQTQATVKANAQLALDGGGMATLKGAMVMIN